MSVRALLHTIGARIRGWLRTASVDAEFEQEMAAHLDAAEDDGVRRGLTRDEARRAALVQLGGLAQLREANRAAQGLPWIGAGWLDLKLGVRLLVKYPGLTLVATSALAIGIAIVAGFHAGTEFIVRPTLPDANGDRIVALWNHDASAADRSRQTLGDMLAWRRELTSVTHVGAFVLHQPAIAGSDGQVRLVLAARISASAFAMLRAAPVIGRPLIEDDERPGAPAVALLGFELWQSAFGADPAIVGQDVRLAGTDHTVIGVMPDGFRFPRREQLWTPLVIPAAGLERGDGPVVEISFGRLAPDATLTEANAEIQVAGSRLAADAPATHGVLRPQVAPYAGALLESNEPGLASMMRAARVLIGIVVVIVAVNVGALVYARNAARVGEVALRMAIGASRRHIAAQMFLEALVLAAVAGAAALVLIAWPVHLLQEVFATSLARGDGVPYWFVVRIGWGTMLVIVGLVLLCAALTGVLPALKLTDRHVRAGLQRMQAGVAGLRFGTAATVIIVAQVAISVALLTVAGAQLRTLVADWVAIDDAAAARTGYLTAQLRWDESDPARQAESWRALGRRLAEEPDVRGATFEAFLGMRPFQAASSAGTSPSWTYVVSTAANFFAVHETPLLAGRPFDAADGGDGRRPVAIVNEAFVRAALAPGDAVGQRIRPFDARAGRTSGDALEIVGVVRDVPAFEISQQGPGWVAQPTIYVPLTPAAAAASTLRATVRVRQKPEQFVPRLSTIAAEIDSTLVVHRPRPIERIDAIDLLFLRLYGYGVAFLVFAVLMLATAGVYSMMSFTVAQRTREIGIRTALGARPARVIADVFAHALRQVGAGTVLGLGLGYAAANGPFALSGGIFQHGPGLMLAVSALITATGGLACGVPLRRALRIQPTEALRAET